MDGDSPIPSHRSTLLDAALLSMIGLYETIELMEKEDGDLYRVVNGYFIVETYWSTFSISLSRLREDFGSQFKLFKFNVNRDKERFQGLMLGEMNVFSSGMNGG